AVSRAFCPDSASGLDGVGQPNRQVRGGRMSGGLSPKRKGYEFERSCVNYMREAGLSCRRVPLSGAGDEKGDICITTGWGEVLRCELKRRKCLPEWIVNALGDHRVMIMREDR